MTDQELQELCRKWQKRLRLQDWDVRVRVVRANDMTKPGLHGEVEWNLNTRYADIKILNPIDYFVGDQIPFDPKQTLVHELLHIHFALCEPEAGGVKEIVFEQGIDAIASALVDLAKGDVGDGEKGKEASAG